MKRLYMIILLMLLPAQRTYATLDWQFEQSLQIQTTQVDKHTFKIVCCNIIDHPTECSPQESLTVHYIGTNFTDVIVPLYTYDFECIHTQNIDVDILKQISTGNRFQAWSL